MTITHLERFAEPMRVETQRKTRSDKGQIKITPRDTEFLTWIGEMYAIRLDHLQKLMGRQRTERPKGAGREGDLAVTTVQTIARRWKRAGLVEYRQMLPGKPAYIWLTNTGFKQTGLPYKNGAPSVARLKHIDTVNALRFWLEDNAKTAWTWTSERAIRNRQNTFNPKVRQNITHIPDGEIVRDDGQRVAVEVELTQKTWSRYPKILEDLSRADYSDFRWFTTEKTYNVIDSLQNDTHIIKELRNKIKLFKIDEEVIRLAGHDYQETDDANEETD